MSRLSRSLALATIGALALSDGPLDAQTWIRSYDDGDRAWLSRVAVLEQGDLLATGPWSTPGTYRPRACVHRFDRLGDTQARAHVDAPQNTLSIRGVAARNADRALAVGAFDGSPWVFEMNTTTLSPSLQFRAAAEPGALESIVPTPDGGFLAAGWLRTTDDEHDVLVLSLDRFLNLRWTRRFGGDHDDVGLSMVSTEDGGCVIAGLSDSFDETQRLWLLSLDADGGERWNRLYRDRSGASPGLPALARSAHGNLGAAWGDGRVLCVGVDGTPLWSFQYVVERGRLNALCATPLDGGFVVAGGLEVDGQHDGWVFKLAANGTVQWQRSVDLGADEAFGGAVPHAGAFVLVGGSEHAEASAIVARISAEGGIPRDCGGVRDTNAEVIAFEVAHSRAVQHDADVAFGGSAWAGTTPAAPTEIDHCRNESRLAFEAYGSGSPGTGDRSPILLGVGGYCDGDETRVEVRNGRGRAPCFLALAMDELELPFAGGHLYVDLSGPSALLPLRLGGASGQPGQGGLTLPVGADYGPHSGLRLHAQALVVDPEAPQGFALSNGLRADID